MAKVHTNVKSALTRLALLFGASLMLWMSSGAGVALAGKTTTQPTNAAQNQYIEKVPTIHGTKHSAKRHKSTSATTTTRGASETATTHAGEKTTATVVGTHRRTKHRTTKHRKVTKPAKKPAASHRAPAVSSKDHAATGRLTAAVTNGSGGGISVWLLVVLILVLVSGSAAGILRYRRNH
jgi:cobalamin biosynthesis Mg chelatase CobN